MGRVDFGKNEVFEGNGYCGLCPQPAIRYDLNDVLRRERVGDGDGKDEFLWLSL